MAKNTLTMSVSVSGVRETVRAFDKLPRDAREEIVDANYKIAASFTSRLRFSAATLGGQGPLLGSTVEAVRDRRVPVIQAGGARPVGSYRKPAYMILLGFDFGSDRYR